MIYEGVFFSFDLVLSLVAVLIVPGGFKGGIPHLCLMRNGEPV